MYYPYPPNLLPQPPEPPMRPVVLAGVSLWRLAMHLLTWIAFLLYGADANKPAFAGQLSHGYPAR